MMRFLLPVLLIFSVPAFSQGPFTLVPPPGTYTEDVVVKATVSGSFQLDYRFSGIEPEVFLPWEDLVLSALPGEKRNYQVIVRARNTAGELYQLPFTYQIEKTAAPAPEKSADSAEPLILSGPEVFFPRNNGIYLHRPWLVLLDTGGMGITYRVSSGEKILESGGYTAPLELPQGENLELKLEGENGYSRTLRYSAGNVLPPGELPRPGFHTSPLVLNPPAGSWKISLDGGDPFPWKESIYLNPQVHLRSTMVLTALSGAQVFQIPLVLDGRSVQLPVWELVQEIPPSLKIHSPSDSFTFMQSGASPRKITGTGMALNETTGSFALVSKYQDGRESTPVTMDSSIWQPYLRSPDLSRQVYGLSGMVPPGLALVYEVSQDLKFLRSPSRDSPQAPPGGIFPQVPKGYLYRTYLRAAFRDAQGRLGKAGPIQELVVDRRVPPAPVIHVSGNSFRLEGRGTLLYSLHPGDVPPESFGDIQPYSGPVPFPSPEGKTRMSWWILAVARDSSGNESLPVRMKAAAGATDPGIQGFKGLTGRSTVNTPEVQLIPEILGVEGDVYYTLSTDGTPPGDPKSQGLLYEGPVSVSAQEGQELPLRSLWNIKSGDSWFYESSLELALTLDRKPPDLPVVSLPPGKYEFSEGAIEIRSAAAHPQDRLFYSAVPGNSLPSALGPEGLPWPGALKLQAPSEEESHFRIQMAVMDPSGNVRVLPEYSIVLNAVEIPPPRLINRQTGASSSFQVDFEPAGEGSIIYELSEGDALPPLPAPESSKFQGPILLSNQGSLTKVFHLRARMMTPEGRLGTPTQLERFVLLPGNTSRQEAPLLGDSVPVITGIPDNSLSARDLSLQVENPGFFRFALGSGETGKMKVDSSSPPVPGKLEIKVSAGRTETFRLLLLDSRTEKVHEYRFTVDKKPPAPPVPVIRETGAVLELQFLTEEGAELTGKYLLKDYSGTREKTTEGLIDPLVRLPLREGSWGVLSWNVQARDPAGNLSSPEVQSFVWHKNVIFIDSSRTEEGDGSARNPFRTLEKGLSMRSELQTRKIILAGGSYTVHEPWSLEEATLQGGFEKKLWTPGGPEPSVIHFTGKGNLQIRGQSFLSHLTFRKDEGFGPVLSALNGKLAWQSLKLEGRSSGEMIRLESSLGSAEDLSITHSGTADTVLLSVHQCDLEIRSLKLVQRGGGNTIGLKAVGSYINAAGMEINILEGGTAWGADLEGSSLFTEKGQWILRDSRLETRLGVLDGSLWVDEGSVRNLHSGGYLTMLFSRGSQIRWQGGSTDITAGTREAAALEFRGQNKGLFRRETWRFTGKVTPLAGEKPGVWVWEAMEMVPSPQ